MPFQTYLRSKASIMSASTSTHSSQTITKPGPPTLYLHHTFSLTRIMAVFALVVLMAIFTTTMWVLLGVPGRSATEGDGSVAVMDKAYTIRWRRDAQGRVGVGLVLGFVVLVLGVLGEAGWVWGSWVLI
jgi:hypothetical protein